MMFLIRRLQFPPPAVPDKVLEGAMVVEARAKVEDLMEVLPFST